MGVVRWANGSESDLMGCAKRPGFCSGTGGRLSAAGAAGVTVGALLLTRNVVEQALRSGECFLVGGFGHLVLGSAARKKERPTLIYSGVFRSETVDFNGKIPRQKPTSLNSNRAAESLQR